jgi:ubiquinone/menaquinone biosynthesis C-methylase UbiE
VEFGGNNILFGEEVARRYDGWYLSPTGRYVERVENLLILDLLAPTAGQRLLDVGCGTGNHLLLFHQMGLDVTGIDPSEPMLHIARDKLGHRADLRVGVAEDLPFDDNSFDLGTVITALEFCEQPFRALAEAFRVGSEKVFIGVLNRLSFTGIQRKLEGVIRPTLYRHARFYSIWELQYMVRRILGVCRVTWGSVIWLPLPLRRWDQAVSGLIPRRKNPFGSFLGLQVELLYTHQAILNPLMAGWVGNQKPEVHPGTLTGLGRSPTPSASMVGEPGTSVRCR